LHKYFNLGGKMISPVMLICFVLLGILVWLAVLMSKIDKLEDLVETKNDRLAELEVILEELVSQEMNEVPP
jgi:hypothetical protein